MSPTHRARAAAILLLLLLAAGGCAGSPEQPARTLPSASAVPAIFDSQAEMAPYLPAGTATGAPSAHPIAAGAQPGSSQDLPASGATRDGILKVQATPLGPDGFSFVFMGDSRDADPEHDDGDRQYTKTVQTVNGTGALFAVHGGDFTFDNRLQQWQRVLEIQRELKPPLLTVIGNHEAIGSRAFYETTFAAPAPATGLDDYSFDYGGVRFISLDNANLTLTEPQFAWLQAQLNTGLARVVMTHAPPCVGLWQLHCMGRDRPEVTTRFLNLMDNNKVNMVLVSHIHVFDDSRRRGNTQYILSGGAGAVLTPFVGRSVFHVVLIHADRAGKLTHRMVPVT